MDDNASNSAPAQPGQYLSFALGEDLFGIRLEEVREINALSTITPVPKTQTFIEGVINLRGKIIPVWNLRLKLGLERVPFTKETCVILTEVQNKEIGMIVDQVRDVIDLKDDQISFKPELGNEIDMKYVLGMAKLKETIAVLIDTASVLTTEDVTMLHKVDEHVA